MPGRTLRTVSRLGTFEFEAPLWQHDGNDGWHFVTVPEDVSADVEDLAGGIRRGFGSVRVAVTVGTTSWRTSVFPTKDGTFVLPVKRQVRVAEQLSPGEQVAVLIELVDL